VASSGGSKGPSKSVPPPPLPAIVPKWKWVCVELSSNGEREKNIPAIIKSARQILGKPDIEVFVPAISQKVRGETQTMVFMDGYVFVRFYENIQYIKLQDTAYFRSVLCTTSSGRKYQYSLLDDKALEPMRVGVQKLKLGQLHYEVGDSVKVIKGDLKNLIGRISEVYSTELVQVSVDHLRSKPIMMDFPVSYLTKIEQ